MSPYSHFSKGDEVTQEAVKCLPPASPETDINIIRQGLAQVIPTFREVQAKDLPDKSSHTVQDRLIPVDDFSVVGFHSRGGFFVGTLDMDEYWLIGLLVELQLVIVSVDYRLAPEFPFPIPLNDSYTALKWCVSNASSINVDPRKGLLVGGGSAGGNITAAIALRARDDPFFEEAGCPVTGQILQAPALLHPKADIPEKYRDLLRSMEENKDAPVINVASYLETIEYYKAPPNDPNVSMILAARHSGLAPAYFQVCGFDPVRDEGLLYEKILRENGVPTKIAVYPGLPHGGGHSHLPISAKYRKDIIHGTRWLLELKQ
ncbi:AB hydrolase superfamily protein [Abortiporus biennis]